MTKIGIDAGGTLVKVAYRNNQAINYQTFPSRSLQDVVSWINKNTQDPELCITGGKSEVLAGKFDVPVQTMVEFDATSKGVEYLLAKSQSGLDKHFILANIGTGTSIHRVEDGRQERIGGTGVGGGTLMGLSSLLTNTCEFEEMVKEAREGERQYVDLKVKDIFEGAIPPISGDLTASNFGKIHHSSDRRPSTADVLASIMGLIGETVVTICCQAADRFETDSIVYIGSTFRSNPILKKVIEDYTILREKQPYFIENGEFSGAVGALLSLDDKK